MRTSPHIGRLDGVLAGLVLACVPVILLVVFGAPWSTTRVISVWLDLALWLAWAAWTWSILSVARTVYRRVRNHDLDLAVRARGTERLAVRVAAGILWVGSFFIPSTAAMGVNLAPRSSSAQTTAQMAPLASAATAPGATAPDVATTYVVASGDCLWTIAEHQLGDPTRWAEIARLNLGHTMGDGRLFTDPSLIYPGWVLTLSAPVRATEATPSPVAPRLKTPVVTPAPHPSDVSSTTMRAAGLSASSALGFDALLIPAGLGLGAVLMGLALRRRKRASAMASHDDGVDLDLALARTSPLIATDLLERACVLADRDGALDAPAYVELDEDGARLSRAGRQCWSALPQDLDHPIEVDRAPGFVLVLGEYAARTYALIVPRGTAAVLSGAGAIKNLEDSIRLQGEFSWGPLLGDASLEEERASIDLGGAGEPAASAVLHLAPVADLVIAEGTFSIESLGIEAPAAQLSEELVELLSHEQGPVERAPLVATGAVEAELCVRLLCAVPRIDGLVAALEPKRARRATELVAYLALNRPGPITGDRLRTRVLGSSDADAAAKTLFNVASAARRALGLDANGIARLPSATRLGQYTLSEEVGTDLDAFARHLAAAAHGDDTEAEIAHLRSALDLIEDEPMAAALSGWEWFGAEGHRARLEAAVEQAALCLVEKCLPRGLFDLADHGLRRAQLVIPYSEALAERAMDLAAARGDLRSLRAAYGDLGRVVEALDPGCWPIASIEQRYRGLLESAQANFAAMDAAPRSTSPSAPAAL